MGWLICFVAQVKTQDHLGKRDRFPQLSGRQEYESQPVGKQGARPATPIRRRPQIFWGPDLQVLPRAEVGPLDLWTSLSPWQTFATTAEKIFRGPVLPGQ